MKLRSKIFITVIILIIMPIVLATVSVYVITNYQAFKMQAKYNISLDTAQSIANPMLILDWITSSYYDDLQDLSESSPEKFMDREFLEEFNSNIKKDYAFLVVRIDGKMTYIGNEDKYNKIDKEFPDYEGDENYDKNEKKKDKNNSAFGENKDDEGEYNTIYLSGSYPCMLKQQDFVYDKHKGSAFIVIDTNLILPEVKNFAIQCVSVFIFIVCLSTIVLVTWLYKSILRPLKELSSATRRISGGDLDFTMDYNKDDELGQLCNDFEDMRIQLKELIENQQLYEKESRELVSNISHDLKTPLTAIKGYAEGLMDGVAKTEEKQKKYLRTIYNKANAMTALVEELSLYSKVEGNMIMYEFLPINIDRYFTDCLDELVLDVEVKGMTITYTNLCDKDINVVIDGEQVKRVIDNVVNNSVKYIEDKSNGKIEVILTKKDNFVRVEIKDNGKGMAKEDIPLIFERFYRTDSSRNSAQGGTGLGLSIAKKIIEDHNGKIFVESEEGVGTSIIFTLPIEQDDESLSKDEDNVGDGGITNDTTEVQKRKKRIIKKPKYSFKINTLGRKKRQN